MWTALLGAEVLDLEAMPAADKLTLRQESPRFVCRGCKGPVHTRHVPDGDDTDPFLVFAHNPGAAEICRELGFHTDESDAHHKLKATLAGAARRAGWTAELEVPGDGCRADVVVTNGNRTRVFEAQISALNVTEAVERTRRYEASFGEPLWTHTRRREWSTRVPSIRITDDESMTTPTVIGGVMTDQAGNVPAAPTALTSVIPRILGGHLRYVFDAGEQFGFYLDLTAAASPNGLPPEPRIDVHPRGTHVSETCDRTTDFAGNAGADLTGRLPCVWCKNPTARRAADGNPRHAWCEETRPKPWTKVRRPEKGT